MTEAIVVAIITGGLAIIGNLITNGKLKTIIIYRLEELEKKQDKHNEVITRTFELEKNIDILSERQKTANHRIDDLEKNQEK